MLKAKKIVLFASGLLVLSGTAWSVVRASQSAAGLAHVGRGDIVREVVAPGVVEPAADQVALGFETAGRIVEIAVREGDRVEEGQLLARLDDRLARARVAGAEAALASARARRDLAFHGARAAEIRAAEAELEAASVHARDRASWQARTERLAGGGAMSEADADGAKNALDAAKASTAAAEARLDLVRQGERGEVRRDAVAAVAAADAALEQAKILLAQTELRAPRAGVVLRRSMEPGEQVVMTPPEVVLTLADVDHLQVRAEIDETDVGRVSIGQRGFVTADAYGDRRFPGHVSRVLGELGRKTLRMDDPHARADTRVLEVIFSLDEPSALPLGLRMDAHVQVTERRGVLTVPLAAVHRDAGDAQVTVLVGGDKATRAVELGADDGVVVEVTRGLSEGEPIAAE